MEKSKSSLLKILGGPLLLLVTGIISVFLCELILRLLMPQPLLGSMPKFAPVDGLEKYQLAPDQNHDFSTLDGKFNVVTSPSGNRGQDPGFILDKVDSEPAYKRLLFSGDSFCFGNGVNYEETLPYLIQKKLGDDTLKVECFNIGQPGYSAPQTKARTINWLKRWNADKVYYLFFVGNDFYDGHPDRLKSLWIDDNGIIRVDVLSDQERGTSSMESFRTWLWQKSMLYSLLRRSLAAFKAPPPDPALLYSSTLPTGDSILVNTVQASLKEMKDYCDSTNTDFTLIIIPSLLQSDDQWWNSFADKSELSPERYGPQKWLKEYCSTINIKSINLLSPVEKIGQKAFLPTDRHFTPEAWEIVADYILKQEKQEVSVK